MIFSQCYIHSLFRVATLQVEGININSKLYTLLKVTKGPWNPKFQSHIMAELKLNLYILFIADM